MLIITEDLILIITEGLLSGEKEDICWQLGDFGFPEEVLSNLLETIKAPKLLS